MSEQGGKKEEVVVLAGVRARMAAYQAEIERKEKNRRARGKPVFKVEEDLGVSFQTSDGKPLRDKMPVQEDGSLSQVDYAHEAGDVDHVFQRSMHGSGKHPFVNGSVTPIEDEFGVIEPEKPQEVKDEEEKQAKEKIGILLGKHDDSETKEEVVLQGFASVQKRYLRAVQKLRPVRFIIPKKPPTIPESEGVTPEATPPKETPEVAKDEKSKDEKTAEFKTEMKKLNTEMDKSKHLSELTSTWDEYYEKAQDKPTEEEEVKQVEEEIKQVEEEVNNDWAEFAEEVVEVVVQHAKEIKGDDDDASTASDDSDMAQWREEARRLKAEAEERKKQKADREERKKKRAQIAAIRKKRAEEAAAKKKAEEMEVHRLAAEEARQKAEDDARLTEESRNAAVEEARIRSEQAKKKVEDMESDSESSESSSSVETPEQEPERAPEKKSPAKEKPSEKDSKKLQNRAPSPPTFQSENFARPEKFENSDSEYDDGNVKTKKKSRKAEPTKVVEQSDSESSEENATKQTKKKVKKKKDKEKDKTKDKEKKKRSKKKDGKKKGEDESDLDDGWVEEYPRNLDGTLWRNPLKFWTNKPKKLNEVAPKVIMKPNPNSDVFCKSEDAINDNASFYWHKFDGDFNVLVKIKANIRTSYDKAGIMIRQDERNWVMSGLEFFNKRVNHSSCITRGISDWSLAPLPDEAKDGVWIAIKRHSNKVECFYSFDLKEWIQTRQGLFPTTQTVKVGIVAACPMGDPFKVVFERFRIQMVG